MANYEQSLRELENIVYKLESGNLSLDENMALFEKGMKLAQDCNQALEQAQAKLEVLMPTSGEIKQVEEKSLEEGMD